MPKLDSPVHGLICRMPENTRAKIVLPYRLDVVVLLVLVVVFWWGAGEVKLVGLRKGVVKEQGVTVCPRVKEG